MSHTLCTAIAPCRAGQQLHHASGTQQWTDRGGESWKHLTRWDHTIEEGYCYLRGLYMKLILPQVFPQAVKSTAYVAELQLLLFSRQGWQKRGCAPMGALGLFPRCVVYTCCISSCFETHCSNFGSKDVWQISTSYCILFGHSLFVFFCPQRLVH
jgi:hypothetical protein